MRVKAAVRALALVVAAGTLTACGGGFSEAIDEYLPKREPKYKSSKRLPSLEVPPDLSRSAINDSLPVPAVGATTYSDYNRAAEPGKAVQAAGVLPDFSLSRVERAGDKRWLRVDAAPGQVWPKMRDFWLEQGFILQMEDPTIGIMETDWAEERADFRTGVIERLLSKISSALYGSATRDKFRTRLERGDGPGATEIYISHRGAEEVATAIGGQAVRSGDDNRVWQPRASDPELEAEMLNRMLVYFGVSEQRAQEIMAQGPKRPDRARMVRERSGASVLSLREDFSRAWRRTGLALDRVGFTVEDRDRSRGLYFVRYVDPDQDLGNQNKGLLSKLQFWKSDEKPERTEYLISLIGGDSDTQVIVLNKRGEREVSRTANRILSLLHEQLR